MDSFFGSSGSHWSYESLTNFRQITPKVQEHLKLVYLTLSSAVVAAAVGAYLHILWNIGGILTFLGCVGGITWLMATPQSEKAKRVRLLMAVAVLQGATVGPLIHFAIEFDTSILITAFIGTAIAFACFSAAALVAKRQQYIYLGGLLSSGLSILLWLRFASSLFGNSVSMFNAEIYFGLLLFLGYIVFDTQMIVRRGARGHYGF